MSTRAADVTRPARDPGRMYPPPPITKGGYVLRWGLTVAPPVLLALMMGVGYVFAAHEGVDAPLQWVPWRIAFDVAATVAAFFLIRRRRRRPVMVASVLMLLATLSIGAGSFIPWAFVSLCTRRRWREVLPVTALGIVTSLVAGLLPRGDSPIFGPDATAVQMGVTLLVMLVFLNLMYGILIAMGFYLGARRDLLASLLERAETAEREQQLVVAAAQSNERARIAREMHDVLAHRISLVSMHAGVLAYRDDLAPEQTKEIAGIIQENAHASLTELRQVLSTLREPAALGLGVEAPQPTLDDIQTLVREAQLSGTRVDLRDEIGDHDSVPAPLARHVYRMVQESLTNARKHAVGAPVQVSLGGRPGRGLTLEVRNPMTGASAVPGSRLGLVGLAERAQLLGGSFGAGPEHGDFVVRAWLPWEK